jgi:diacylglycerol kinase family enzyme
MISNTTLMEKPPSLLGPPETLGNGRLEVYVLSARTLGDYMRLAWHFLVRPGHPATKLSHWTATRSARVDTVRRSRLVQADGDVIGRTPVEVQVFPKAIRVIVPKPPAPSAAR